MGERRRWAAREREADFVRLPSKVGRVKQRTPDRTFSVATQRDGRRQDPLEVRASTVHGNGVFALRRIVKGEVVGAYAGRRYPPGAIIDRDPLSEVIYSFGLSDWTIIGGAEGGNKTRHLNHSCAPNCEAVEAQSAGGQIEIEFDALRTILQGEEVFIDYWLARDAGDDGAYLCRCGVVKCRGTTLARRPQRRRAGARKAP
jgi:SET domain-containing protein